jgi:uncharacterized membrane protein YphA (DoxX/SURF4 family)
MDDVGLAAVAAAVLTILRLAVAGVFIRAGTVKLAGLAEFRLAVANYQILPTGLVGAAAVGVPVLEAAAGVLLLLGIFSAVVAAVLAVLLLCFSAAIGLNLARGRVFDCGCGGSTVPQLINWRHVAVNGLLAAAAIAILIAPPGGLELLRGPRGLFSIGIPGGSGAPVVLAAVLVFISARTLGAAAGAHRSLLRASRG